MTSPFASIASALLAQGYSPIPIMPGDKAPGMLIGDEWRHMRGWSRFCGAAPSAFQVKMWSAWERAGIGVACGRGLIGFDIDRDDLVAPIRAVLPPVVVAKRGRKGETLFFRGDTDAIRSRGFKIDGVGVMDLIAHGKQTVLPPSVHMVTGDPYAWTTERTLGDTPLADLSEVTAEHMAAVVGVLQSVGYKAEAEIAPSAPRGEIDPDAETEFYRQLNEDALRDLGAWVPRLGLARLTRTGDGFRSVAEWRPSSDGNPIHKRRLLLSINPAGIVDYGDGDRGYTPLNLVMAAFDADLDVATRWLGEAIGWDFRPKMVLNLNRITSQRDDAITAQRNNAPEVVAAATAYREASAGKVDEQPDPFADFGLPDHGPPPRPKPAPEPADPVLAPVPAPAGASPWSTAIEPMTHVPGLVGEIVDWMVASSSNPCRALALPAALTLVGTLAGRLYASETDLRTNLYTLGLADSGFGKDHARECIKRLLTDAGLMRFLGGDSIMSGSGMRKRVEEQPAIMWSIDEMGGFIRQISDKRNVHSFQIRDYLLKYTSSASTSMQGADYAGESGTVCYNPNVGLYGVSTPADFYDALGTLSINDGLLARVLCWPVDGPPPPDTRPTASKSKPPGRIIDGLRALVVPRVGGNLNGRTSDGSTKCDPMVVPWADREAEDLWWTIRGHFRAKERAATEAKSMWNRAAEQAQKVALILAIGINPERPAITCELLTRGREIAEVCIAATIDAVTGRVADNPGQREHLDVKRYIIEAGPTGLSKTALGRKVNGRFNARRLDEILIYLQSVSKEVDAVIVPTKGRSQSRYVSVRYLSDPEAA
jgi:hypothetical protein